MTTTALIPSLHTQRRVVGIAVRPSCKEGASVRLIERCLACKPDREIGVGNKELAKGYCVRFAVLNDLFGQGLSVFLVCNVNTAELFLELRTQPIRTELLAGAQKGKFAFAEFMRHVAEGG